ncbi:TonB-dependent receptor plug domain-containing protein [Salinimonas sediminis]|uniref:TonB-dependent receptor n=1 Tax=Salinimonas sediminis TaxID=2303538 RepID=A0A346NQ86_9ALTE|nr:TonB-dependent receptor [Salinimonas sediminis]AXR07693.1 TonB-dependent receptor [Salinimonas sediminis]
MKRTKISAAIGAGLTGLSLVWASQLQAQEAVDTEQPQSADALERIAVVGARGAPRSVTSSPVPIDVLSADDMNSVAFSDMNDVMKTLVPSYSLSRQPISDGGTFVRPATLRGLPTDKTLVLVNSKRRHRAALVSIGGSGTQGPDLATIPTAAIANVEVLRDGATAQYGSDAIAGVINFQLKNNNEGGMFSAEWGQHYEGDGEQLTLSGNKGFALGDDGFVSVSVEYADTESTNRGEQYCESWFCVDPDLAGFDPDADYAAYVTDDFLAAAQAMGQNVHDSDFVQPWGQPETEATRVFINAGYVLSNTAELYGFGNYSSSEGAGPFFYRYPENGTIENVRLEDGSLYSPLEHFPGGFTPRFSGDVADYSVVGGVKGMLGALGYDISGRYGYNEIEYTLSNTINPSMMDASPTSFNPGTLTNDELQFQADFTYDFNEYVLAFGLSYMDESYELEEGEAASYEAGPYALSDPWGLCEAQVATAAGLAVIANGSTLNCADDNDPVYTVVGVGSNGFPGYSPEFSGEYTRDSHAAYLDISGDLSAKLFGQAAVRYEDYSDFGSQIVYKVAGIYQLTDEIGLRASYGTGFRAPTPGQQGTTNVSTRLPNGFPVATGLFPALSAVSQALGAEALRPEESTNITFGMTANYGDLTLTLDYYHILLEDRVNSISTRDVSTDPTAEDAYANYLALAGAGVIGAESIGGVFYFQNAFDTVTEGVDFVANYAISSDYGNTTLTASVNYNTNSFDSDPSSYFNLEDQFDFEQGTPEMRGVFSLRHSYDAWELVGRLSYYGDYKNADGIETQEDGSETLVRIQEFDPEWMFDLEGTYHFSDTLSLIAGVRNLFDNYPDPGEIGETCCGRIYRSDSIVDWQGGYYYTKLVARF